jgi:hypothetical protein
MSTDLPALATEAFFYGYPIVANNNEVVRFVAHGLGSVPATPFNTFGHAKALAGPEDTFVTVNNDTVYSIAPMDLGVGPMVLHVPDTAGRYYVLQFVDTWSNNFAYLGKRATGTGKADFLLVPPGWNGAAPEGMRVIHAPTRIFTIVGRIAVNGADDLQNVYALQNNFELRPLEPGREPEGIPAPDPNVPHPLEFWEKMRVWMRAFPPSATDIEVQQRFAPLGLLDEKSPFVEADPALVATLDHGLAVAHDKMEQATKSQPALPSGWSLTTHAFDYNLDFYEIGALDAPEWKIASRNEAYLTRAVAARAGLWGNHAYEALYGMTYVDDKGEPLSGEYKYQIRFAPPPPVGAFWSLTMYDMPNYYLVANPINRYSIGDRTPGLKTNEDGSLTIYIQKDSPGADKESNWLPAPAGEFRPVLRMYQPGAEIFSGEWTPPAIERAS